MVQNVLTYTVAISKREIVVIETILVDEIDSGPQRYEHWKGPLYDVKISRHLNVHWGQQTALFGLIQLICGQQHAIGCLVVDWGTKMQNTKSKNCFLKVRLNVLTKNGLFYCYLWVTCSCLLWPLLKPLATQQMSNISFGYTLHQKKLHRARLNEFKKVGKFVTF